MVLDNVTKSLIINGNSLWVRVCVCIAECIWSLWISMVNATKKHGPSFTLWVFDTAALTPMLGLPGWVASCRQGRMKLSFSFLTQWMPTVEECDPPLCSVPSLRCPAWELLGNQNQLLFLSPLSSFWHSVNCRVVFCVNSMTTRVAQTSSCRGKSSILIFLQFYCSTGTVTYVETLRNNVGICYLSRARERRWIIAGK